MLTTSDKSPARSRLLQLRTMFPSILLRLRDNSSSCLNPNSALVVARRPTTPLAHSAICNCTREKKKHFLQKVNCPRRTGLLHMFQCWYRSPIMRQKLSRGMDLRLGPPSSDFTGKTVNSQTPLRITSAHQLSTNCIRLQLPSFSGCHSPSFQSFVEKIMPNSIANIQLKLMN